MNGSVEKYNVDILHKMSGLYQVISVKGTLVYQNMQIAKEKINEIFVETDGYILDFTDITKIDSTGFGLIFNIVKRKPKDAGVVAVVSDPFIRELFNITKIDQLIPIATSTGEALSIVDGLKSLDSVKGTG